MNMSAVEFPLPPPDDKEGSNAASTLCDSPRPLPEPPVTLRLNMTVLLPVVIKEISVTSACVIYFSSQMALESVGVPELQQAPTFEFPPPPQTTPPPVSTNTGLPASLSSPAPLKTGEYRTPTKSVGALSRSTDCIDVHDNTLSVSRKFNSLGVLTSSCRPDLPLRRFAPFSPVNISLTDCIRLTLYFPMTILVAHGQLSRHCVLSEVL
ncbi:unnamed protein product [Dibothriocephalus latus]|uniref:Uncharacterized protein n=1 Tax=Dibothriocephalus latus TaxID=60516 RepID=A0A3P7MPI9_DIBLA|nr:unnamed protein product [Dibothriocephalus latus]